MTQSALKHIVCITGCGWSHIRPIVQFCMRLADKFPTSFISIFTHPVFVSQVQQYISTYPHLAPGRIVVDASIFGNPSNNALDLLDDMEKGFGPWIANQIERIEFISNGIHVDTPSYIIEDHLNGGISVTNKQFHQLPIAGWYVATATGFLGHFGNAEHGQGWRHFEAVRAAVAKHGIDGRNLLDIYAQEIIKSRVVYAPGVPAYYEHEQIPQPQSTALPMIVRMHGKWMAMLEHINAIVYNSLYEMEPIAARASAEGLLKPIPSFCTGLAVDVPPQSNLALHENTEDPVALFMNRAFTELGQYSVVYISFGSYCHPAPESISHLKILIEEILAHDFRLVFSIQSHNAKNTGLDEGYVRQIANSGRAIFPEWTKQLDVLEHPAMHYFISHGGWNSTTEAITRGIPMIFWPIAGDQPSNAMQMTRQLDCGFELLQVRTGVAKSVAYSTNGDIPIIGSDQAVREEIRRVLKMTRGVRGLQQRMNIKNLGQIAMHSNEAGGSADLALRRFGRLLGL